MSTLCDFLEEGGIEDPQALLSFIDAFSADPGIFYSMSDTEQAAMKNRMNQAYDAIFNNLGGQG